MEYKCGNCGADIQDVDSGKCPKCGSEFEIPMDPIPWEERDKLGIVGAYTATLLLSFSKPNQFFKRMPVSGGFANPLIYALICGLIGTWFNFLWQLLFISMGILEADPQSPDSTLGFNLLLAVLSPVIIPVGLLLGTGAIHIALNLLGVARNNFEATFRVVCYSSGATVLGIVPIIGSIAGGFLSIALETMGLREVYEIRTGKAFAAIMIPFLFLCGVHFFALLISSTPGG